MKMIEGQEYIEYYVDFIDGIKYRNQPLDIYLEVNLQVVKIF